MAWRPALGMNCIAPNSSPKKCCCFHLNWSCMSNLLSHRLPDHEKVMKDRSAMNKGDIVSDQDA
jgi:hypothetical protein